MAGKAGFTDARGFGNSKRRLSATERKSSVDGIDSKESRAVIKILSKGSIHAEAETLFKNFDKNLSKNLDREEFRRLLRDLDENKRDPLPANFEYDIFSLLLFMTIKLTACAQQMGMDFRGQRQRWCHYPGRTGARDFQISGIPESAARHPEAHPEA